MPYFQDGWKQCKRCGSYMPSDWARCGRCGYPAGGRRKKGGKGWIAILVLVFAIFVFRNELLDLVPDDIIGRVTDIFPGGMPNGGDSYAQRRDPLPGPATAKPENTGSAGNETMFAEPGGESAGSHESNASGDSATEDKIRALIHDALKNADGSVRLPVLNTGNDSGIVFGIIEQVILSDPEIMFYEGCTYRTDGLLALRYAKSRDSVLKAVQDTKQAADGIIAKIIKPGMSDYEKELAIHDYIVKRCRYDVEALQKGAVPSEGHEAYGPLVAGKAVCEGYAKAMKLLLNRAGIECLIVAGTSKGESHAWNIARISGRYYHVDATWDDPVMQNGDQILQHTYFNLTDKDIAADHKWEKADYPACTATAANYFYYNGLVASSGDEFTTLLRSAVKSGHNSLSVRFVDGSAKSIDIPRLLEREAAELNLGSISYSVNDDYGVVDVWF